MTKKTNKKTTLTPIISGPTIDKVTLVVDMIDPTMHGTLVSEIVDYAKNGNGSFVGRTLQFRTSVLLPVPGSKEKTRGVLVQATAKQSGKPKLKISYNADHLFGSCGMETRAANIEYLDSTFNEFWGGGFFELLHHSRVGCLEVFRQIEELQPDDVLIRAKYFHTANAFFALDGTTQTLNFGRRASNQLIAYNKAQQLNPEGEEDSLRIEYRLRPKGLKALDLHGLDDPFLNVELFSLKGSIPPFSKGHWLAFQDCARRRGLTAALKLYDTKTAAQIRKALKPSFTDWWRLDVAEWDSAWKHALEASALSLIPPFAQSLNAEQNGNT